MYNIIIHINVKLYWKYNMQDNNMVFGVKKVVMFVGGTCNYDI